MMAFILAWLYPIYVNVSQHRKMDNHWKTDLGIAPAAAEKQIELERGVEQSRPSTEIVENVK